MRIVRGLLIEQTISSSQAVLTQSALEITDVRLVRASIICRRQQLEPNRVQLQPPQTEHPLQRHGKIAAALAIFGGETTTEEDRHAGESQL